MKKNRILVSILTLCCVMFLFSCSKEEMEVKDGQIEEVYFSKEDIANLEVWIKSQTVGELDMSGFPELSFNVTEVSTSDPEVLNFYQNGIMYLTDDIRSGEHLDFESITEQILKDSRLDESGKVTLLSFIQLSSELFISDLYSTPNSRQEAACNCSGLYSTYVNYSIQCQAYGNYWGHCTAANNAYAAYLSCLSKVTTCPAGFSFDGANCYSGIIIPSGYNPFIYGNGFYTQRNCSISTANNCCPSGFGYDGANCHYWGLYFPSDYEPFIWGNSFYVVPKCL